MASPRPILIIDDDADLRATLVEHLSLDGEFAAEEAGSAAEATAKLADAESRYDAILLDVDNGPSGLTRGANDGLYGDAGLRAALRALSPGGVLAVWSATPDDRFVTRLERSGFKVEEKRVRAGANGRGARHVIWLATAA